MGLLLGRSATAETELPHELRSLSQGESGAVGSGQSLVFFCPRCHRRLCPLSRASGTNGGAAASQALTWRIPASRLEKAFFGGAAIKCLHCGAGRVSVEELSKTSSSASDDAHDEDYGLAGDQAVGAKTAPVPCLTVALRPAQPRQAVFRPFSACVCGCYDSVIDRAAAALSALNSCGPAGAKRRIHISRKTLRRSELSSSSSDALLPALALDLVVVAHRISGQRNPITDAHGLYTNLIEVAWSRADVVLVFLLDVPCEGYLSRMLDEQPTLLGLLSSGRLLPIFALPGEGGQAEAEPAAERVEDSAVAAPPPPESIGWLARCLDGKVPRIETTGELAQASGCGGAAVREATARAAATAAKEANTTSLLKAVAEGFLGRLLVRDAL